ncbi:MAG: hypothetical protein RLZZ292_1300 [Bacteroidota bacterium]|jgi:hypothetical protein
MKKNTSKQQGNIFDKVVKENLDEVFIPFVINSLGIDISTVVVAILPDKLFTTEEREMDLLLKLTDTKGRVFLLHVEFQSKPDYEMIWRMIEYHGMITRIYKFPIVHVVVDLDDSKSNITTNLDDQFVFRGFKIIKLHDIDYSRMIASQIPAEIILAILGNFGNTKPEIIIRAIAQRLKTVSKSDAELKKYVAQLNVLSRLRNLQDLITQTISKNMPITFDFENDSIAKVAISRKDRRNIEKMLLMTTLSPIEISIILEVEETLVYEIKQEIERKKQKK